MPQSAKLQSAMPQSAKLQSAKLQIWTGRLRRDGSGGFRPIAGPAQVREILELAA